MEMEELLKLIVQSQEVKAIEIETAVSLFITLNSEYKRPDTIQYYKDHLKPFLAFCSIRAIKSTNQITKSFLEDYRSYLKYQNNQNSTINKRRQLVQILFNYLSNQGYVTRQDFQLQKLEVTEKEIKIIPMSELEKILNYIECKSIKIKLILLLLISTGIRRTELTFIKIQNIDLNDNKIYLERTKGKKTRYIYLVQKVKNALIEYLNTIQQQVYLFEQKNGQKLNSSAITYITWYLCKELKIPQISPHKYRHAFGTYLLKNGADMEEVRKLLGHGDYRMTLKYVHYLNTDLARANDKYNPLNNLKKKTTPHE